MHKILLFISAIALSSTLNAQIGLSSQRSYDKWSTGGNVGLSFGNNSYFGFNISPFIGYAVFPKATLGLTAGYQYDKNDYFKTNLFSVGPFINYNVFQSIFLRTHYEYYSGNQQMTNSLQNGKYSFDESALWIGGGYQSVGKLRFQTGLMYNVLYEENESIFGSALRPFAGVVVSL